MMLLAMHDNQCSGVPVLSHFERMDYFHYSVYEVLLRIYIYVCVYIYIYIYIYYQVFLLINICKIF